MIRMLFLWLPFFGVLSAGCSGASNEPKPQAPAHAIGSEATAKDGACCQNKHDTAPLTDLKIRPADGAIPQVIPVGRNHHAEVVLEKKGMLRIHTLGKDQAEVVEVDIQKLEATARAEGVKDTISFVLQAAPAPADAAGKTSQFVGELPPTLHGKTVYLTVSIRVAGEQCRFGFGLAQGGAAGMPVKAVDEEERQLYLAPGGKYTAEDIKANGSLTSSQKYDVHGWVHSNRPKAGERICPVTLTKANPGCTWIIGGKKYEFCCPPCIDAFLQLAKEQPDQIEAPESYRKK